LSILFQVVATIIATLFSFEIKIYLVNIFDLGIHNYWNFLNILGVCILMISATYSLLLTPYVVANIFSLSQLNNLYLTIENYSPPSNETIDENGPK